MKLLQFLVVNPYNNLTSTADYHVCFVDDNSTVIRRVDDV